MEDEYLDSYWEDLYDTDPYERWDDYNVFEEREIMNDNEGYDEYDEYDEQEPRIRKMCDPPEGWKYGFPKAIPEGVEFSAFLLDNGYPEDLLSLAKRSTRFWEESF